jgi:hypothetical protein
MGYNSSQSYATLVEMIIDEGIFTNISPGAMSYMAIIPGYALSPLPNMTGYLTFPIIPPLSVISFCSLYRLSLVYFGHFVSR